MPYNSLAYTTKLVIKFALISLFFLHHQESYSAQSSGYESIIEQNIGNTGYDLIVSDISLKIDDVIKTDQGEIGYVRYQFTATLHAKQTLELTARSMSAENDQTIIQYTLVVEGADVPELHEYPYLLGSCPIALKRKTDIPLWEVTDNGHKLPLKDRLDLALAEKLLDSEAVALKRVNRAQACKVQ